MIAYLITNEVSLIDGPKSPDLQAWLSKALEIVNSAKERLWDQESAHEEADAAHPDASVKD